MTQLETYPDNLTYLQGALLVLNLRLHRQVLRWRATHHPEASPDELLGLYISDREVDVVLDGLYASSAPPDADALDEKPITALSTLLADAETRHQERKAASLDAGVPLRLPQLAERLGLDAFEEQTILLALAPELDRHYERLFAYLNDEAAHRWPTVDLALQLFCSDLTERVTRRRIFALDAPLRRLCLVHLYEDPGAAQRTLIAGGIKLDERLTAYLLETESLDPVLDGLLRLYAGPHVSPILDSAPEAAVASLHAYLCRQPTPAPIVAITGPDRRIQADVAAHLAAAYSGESDLLLLDGQALSTHSRPDDVAARTLREMRLQGAALAIQDADAPLATTPSNARRSTTPRSNPAAREALRRLATESCQRPRFLLADDPRSLSDLALETALLTLHLPAASNEARRRMWAASLNGQAAKVDLAELADRYRLTSAQIAAAAEQARVQAAVSSNGQGVEADAGLHRDALFASCRRQSNTALAELAQPIESIHTWSDLVLPSAVKAQLRSLEHWMHYRHVVYGDWGYEQRVMLGRGLAVLFSGPSGTGKTMAAGILARTLALELYRVDLSTVVSKYIGETEKNLSRIFEVAESANAILFFDEADALFGKRSEVKDAHDRYANIEVSYLLQRMEAYEGMAILATNFRENLDQAFARRLHVIIEFPFPQSSDRERIWRRLLPADVPQSDAIDFAYLAGQFALSGGSIKNCVLAAAFAAAAEDAAIGMRHLVQAVAQELEKMDQPVMRSEFGPYYDLLRADGAAERSLS